MSNTSTPAAKRRRIETANSTLRKPFRSPVIKPPGQGASPTAETPVRPRAGPARNAVGSGTPSKVAPRARGPGFVWAERRGEFEAENAALEVEIARLRGAGEPESKGVEGGDERDELDELDGLMVKWRAAAQQAADELFETSKSRVQRYVSHSLPWFEMADYEGSMGGMKELAAMRRRQAEFFNEDLGQPVRRAESDDGSVGGEMYDEAEGEEAQDEEQVSSVSLEG